MTTYFQFNTSNRQAPSFMPTFDGLTYKITILWNISAQRYYVNCQDLFGNLIFMVPLVGNPDPFEIESLEYDSQNKRVIITTVEPHNAPVGQVINLNILGCIPTAYNGTGLLFIMNEHQVACPMLQDPGPATSLGVLDYLISMDKSYFLSTLIFRYNNFEVTP
jgi:hypothetical protein